MAAYATRLLCRDKQRHWRCKRLFLASTTLNDVTEHIWKLTYYRPPKEVPALCRSTARTRTLPLDVQVAVNLFFCASGNIQSMVNDLGHFRRESTPRIVNSVSRTIVQRSDLFSWRQRQHRCLSIIKGTVLLTKKAVFAHFPHFFTHILNNDNKGIPLAKASMARDRVWCCSHMVAWARNLCELLAVAGMHVQKQ